MYNEEYIKYMETVSDDIVELSYEKQVKLIKKASKEFNIFEEDVIEYLKSLGIEYCTECLIYNKKEDLVELSTKEFICTICLEGSI